MATHFLGLELATDQLRACILDEKQELVGVERVDFDTELSEYQTQGGIFTTPGEAYTTPVEMWVKALDILLGKLASSYKIKDIKAISGCAQQALVWWKSTPLPALSSLDPGLPLPAHFPAASFSLPHTPTSQDNSSHPHALAIEGALGGAEAMARRVGISAGGNASMLAAQMFRVREMWAKEVWVRTGRVQVASKFLESLVGGKWAGIGEAEACLSGMWNVQGGVWDEGVLDIVGGSREEGRRVRGWLGDVDVNGGGRKAGYVSRYLVDRYGFDPETILTPFTSDTLSTFVSVCPAQSDAVLSFGPTDTFMAQAHTYIPSPIYNIVPHPYQEPGDKKKYIVMLSSRNGDVSRALARDMYTKSWSAFDRLVAIVPPGGSIGLDDKLFSFWHLQPDTPPFTHSKGVHRFETGIKVTEFRDLRANPRCLVESQVMGMRVRWGRAVALGVFGEVKLPPKPPLPPGQMQLPSPIPFDLYQTAYPHLPSRILCTGAATNFPSIANLVCDVFGKPVYVCLSQIDSAQISPHRNAPARGFPGRAAVGVALVAKWVWGKEKESRASSRAGSPHTPTAVTLSFEEDTRKVFARRWTESGGVWARTNVSSSAGGPQTQVPTIRNVLRGGTTLGTSIVMEEEEEENYFSNGGVDAYMYPNANTQVPMISTPTTPTGTMALTPISALPIVYPPEMATLAPPSASVPTTGEQQPDLDLAQIGLARVADPDFDSFLGYASIVWEYVRLESIIVKGG
ncbi:D-xylulose kinase [Armillaria fumosa]|nr:D-xylulose kinase [Armillaria fumosa]